MKIRSRKVIDNKKSLKKIIEFSRNKTKINIIAKKVNGRDKHFETGVLYIPDFKGDYIVLSRKDFDEAFIQIADIKKITEA